MCVNACAEDVVETLFFNSRLAAHSSRHYNATRSAITLCRLYPAGNLSEGETAL